MLGKNSKRQAAGDVRKWWIEQYWTGSEGITDSILTEGSGS